MDSLADADGFLVAYPNGSKGLLALSASDWNAGVCCGAAARDHVNDVGFIGALVARVAAHVPVDRRRVYVAGFSDGARMAYRLACESAATIAAIGAVAGSLVDPQCAPARPVPVVAFHGTADEEVAYLDSARTAPPRPVPPATSALPPSVQFWAAEDGCRDVAVERVSPHVTRATFAPCDGADVVLYTIEGGVHGWPGEPPDGAGSKPPMSELRATDVMVRFFLSHSLRRPVAAASPGPVGSSERR
jgi:polyhydroxybutyrate depolymerase